VSLFAWFRRHSPSRRARRASFRPRLEALEDRAVPAVLNPISDGSTYPFSAVCRIEATFPDGSSAQGTGTLIDRFHVLTAGHMIYDGSAGGWATQVKVTAGESFGASPFGDAYATYERTYDSFINDSNNNANSHDPGDGDIGLLTLDQTLGDQTGWFGFGYNNDDNFYSGAGYNTIGYPGQAGFSGQDMYSQYGNITGTTPGTDPYFGALTWSTSAISSIPGQSGSGLYDYNGGNRRIDGIIELSDDPNNMGNGTGWAERITEGVFNDLVSWMNSDALPTAATLKAGTAAPTLVARAFGEGGAAGLAAPTVASDPASRQRQDVPGEGISHQPHQPEPQPGNLAWAAAAFAHSTEHYTQFVTQAYQQYLGRAPDAAGLAGWVQAMQNGLTDEQLEAGFIGSTEYINNHGGPGAGWVRGMYQDLLGRTPAQSEVDGWVNALNHGVSPQQVAYGFAASTERETIRVKDDYQTYLGREASQAEIRGWVYAFEHGASNEDVVAGFVGSAEYYARPQKGNGNRTDWIISTYTDVLGRTPSDAEVQGWLRVLQ
jgi:V8-like Glu-specific endopeptidase